MILLDDISLTYSSEHEAIKILNQISLQIKAGEWISLIGPSGSGKTSLLKVIGGLLPPTEGLVHIESQNLYEMADAERQDWMRKKMGFVYQQFRLLPQFTVLENVMLPLIPYEKKGLIQEQANDMLQKVGLSHRRSHFPSQLSGGEQQRVAFARALMGKPALLLCDEPTGNLDAMNRDRILQLIEEIHAEGQTILLVTHDETVANRAERTVVLQDAILQEVVDASD